MDSNDGRRVNGLTVNQWLPGWDDVDYDATQHRAKPQPFFYLFALPARELRSLSGIVRREAKGAASRTEDLGIQRQHDPERSEEISRFVEFGYPWSTLSRARRQSAEFNDLRKPGWLPTAVVLNILPRGSERRGIKLADADIASVERTNGTCSLQLPYNNWTKDWRPSGLPPFEIIDGQHRLWAFDSASEHENFELPVVAFLGLDISWQAYLFWTINIKPKRINPSLAFDLYPLLRNEDWLDRAEGHSIYRETRAQELTEILWSFPESPWYDRINMLGEKGSLWVTQNGWIKSLTATFIRAWDRTSGGTGGLFGGRAKKPEDVLGWNRAQQAAFLIFAWASLREAVWEKQDGWARNLRTIAKQNSLDTTKVNDAAFYGQYSLINTDQGVRGYLQVINDLCYLQAARLGLNQWRPNERSSADPVSSLADSLKTLREQPFVQFVRSIATSLASFDWRASSAPGLDETIRRAKLVFRGSGGYKELRTQLFEHLAAGASEAKDIAQRLVAPK
jgi:DGQHR domain-containing protein